ncbi:hypothetical protein B0T17DRAFT_589331 [Bombardia bombarda]|uniref:SUN domain-containing protein n=1 Tax=Bombardia bombarda TaxID=252184 RepID=A0AA39X937_9PEZI|nr:hypothetical protein B0T17DRAFT_589331 [Bombardia bombarda]
MVFIGAFVLLHTLRFLHIVARPDMFDKSPIMRLDWYGWSDWERNIGQFFPSPLLHPLGVLTDRQYDDLERFMRDQKSSTAAAVQNIESILPRMVHVQKRNGKLVIDDEFWHALKNMIQHENSIFTLEGTSDISDTHWKALQGRFRKAGIPGQAGISASDVEDIAGRSVSRYWDTWVKNNHKKVTSILGDNLSVDLEKKLRSETEKLIDNKLASKGLQDVIITKDQFMREIEKAMKDQKKDIDRQLEGVRSSLKTLIEEASKSTSSSVGMTREEITDLVNAVVKKSISNAKLEAAAQSNIGHFYNTELSHRINHCSMGNGALIEISMTSPTWTYSKPAFGTKAWVNFMQKQPRSQPNSFSVLTSWEDAGQCWCAGTKTGKGATRPADVSIRLANFVVPQNIVIEHIDPSATLDPLAMPKDLEIWARYDEYGRHERMTNWMAATFPDANDTELRKLGFVQIGAFTYESKSADRGIFITRLSSELVSNEGATDHILVRAVNNHGTDHTCFYRIRMYGDVLELPAEKQSKL